MFTCHLDSDVFEVIKLGFKNVEVRVNDEKRRKMKVGDEIVFLKRPLEEEKIVSKITKLNIFKNFEELVSEYSIDRLYLKEYSKEQYIELLGRFYSKEEQIKYGVVAIEFEMVK